METFSWTQSVCFLKYVGKIDSSFVFDVTALPKIRELALAVVQYGVFDHPKPESLIEDWIGGNIDVQLISLIIL